MKKKLLILLTMVTCLFTLCGCEKNDVKGTMTAYTSVYPVEFILDNLYGENIAIYSIYPDGINYKDYGLTDKQLEDYSHGDLYVYNGIIKKEKDYAVKLLNNNKKMKIIDATQGMDFENCASESWLNPSNYLMMASNVKKGLEEYINEKVIIKEINKNYEQLKLKLTKIDAELKMIAENKDNNTLVVSSDSFKYLEKYGFNVISIENNENLTNKKIADVKKLLSDKKIKYIFLKDNEEESELIKSLINDYKVQTIRLNSLATLSAADRKDKKDYLTIMNENINSIKLEINK